jgi:PPOX class probable F420-dependent enzyme
VLLTPAGLEFITERHLATFTTLRRDGRPHVTPVGFTWDDATGVARVIASATSRKVAHAALGATVALCQVDGRRWLTLEGVAAVRSDPQSVQRAEQLYAGRYRVPRANPSRVAVEITVHRMYGSSGLVAA